jgi:hypothetical protein
MVQYHFRSPGVTFRPFVGLGVSYNFFTDIKVNPAFAESVNNNLGAILAASAGIPGRLRSPPMRRRRGRRSSIWAAPTTSTSTGA